MAAPGTARMTAPTSTASRSERSVNQLMNVPPGSIGTRWRDYSTGLTTFRLRARRRLDPRHDGVDDLRVDAEVAVRGTRLARTRLRRVTAVERQPLLPRHLEVTQQRGRIGIRRRPAGVVLVTDDQRRHPDVAEAHVAHRFGALPPGARHRRGEHEPIRAIAAESGGTVRRRHRPQAG